jgi:hypothetical protein
MPKHQKAREKINFDRSRAEWQAGQDDVAFLQDHIIRRAKPSLKKDMALSFAIAILIYLAAFAGGSFINSGFLNFLATYPFYVIPAISAGTFFLCPLARKIKTNYRCAGMEPADIQIQRLDNDNPNVDEQIIRVRYLQFIDHEKLRRCVALVKANANDFVAQTDLPNYRQQCVYELIIACRANGRTAVGAVDYGDLSNPERFRIISINKGFRWSKVTDDLLSGNVFQAFRSLFNGSNLKVSDQKEAAEALSLLNSRPKLLGRNGVVDPRVPFVEAVPVGLRFTIDLRAVPAIIMSPEFRALLEGVEKKANEERVPGTKPLRLTDGLDRVIALTNVDVAQHRLIRAQEQYATAANEPLCIESLHQGLKYVGLGFLVVAGISAVGIIMVMAAPTIPLFASAPYLFMSLVGNISTLGLVVGVVGAVSAFAGRKICSNFLHNAASERAERDQALAAVEGINTQSQLEKAMLTASAPHAVKAEITTPFSRIDTPRSHEVLSEKHLASLAAMQNPIRELFSRSELRPGENRRLHERHFQESKHDRGREELTQLDQEHRSSLLARGLVETFSRESSGVVDKPVTMSERLEAQNLIQPKQSRHLLDFFRNLPSHVKKLLPGFGKNKSL